MKFDYENCLRQGLLRKIPVSIEKSDKSIGASYKWLEEAEKNFQVKSFNSCVLNSYLAMFHAGRAVLYFDGFREKSHACIARYLESVYVNKNLLDKKWVDFLDYYRELRHNDQYGLNFYATKEECEDALGVARDFVKEIVALLEKLK